MSTIDWSLSELTPAQQADMVQESWPSPRTWPLPLLPPGGSDVQVFVRLDFGDPHVVTLNGTLVGVPLRRDRRTRRYVGMLPVPTPHVTVRYLPQVWVDPDDPTNTKEYTLIEVRTE